jgi:hypothetical protein
VLGGILKVAWRRGVNFMVDLLAPNLTLSSAHTSCIPKKTLLKFLGWWAGKVQAARTGRFGRWLLTFFSTDKENVCLELATSKVGAPGKGPRNCRTCLFSSRAHLIISHCWVGQTASHRSVFAVNRRKFTRRDDEARGGGGGGLGMGKSWVAQKIKWRHWGFFKVTC